MKTITTTIIGLLMCTLAFAQPSNDNCTNAIPLIVNGNCLQTNANNTAATASGELPNPNCGAYQGGDVWFSVTVPSSGKMVIEAESPNIEPVIALYTGTCGNLTLVTCNADGPISLDNRTILHDNSLAGTPILVRLFAISNNGSGAYKICAYETSIPENDFCDLAINFGLPPTSAEPFIDYDGTFVTGNADNGDPGCGSTMSTYHDMWFKLIIPPSGTVTIETHPDDKVVIAVYDGNDCFSLVQVGCNYNNAGSVFNYDEITNVGRDLFIRIMKFDSKFGAKFRLRVFETEPLPLPVELTSFECRQKDQQVDVTWRTASEINNSHFDIQHSRDGETWRSLGVVNGNGTTAEETNYSFIHHNPNFGTNYYKIRQVDFDGTFAYSPIRVVEFDGKDIIRVWPVPSKGNFTLEMAPDALEDDEVYTISIHNSNGKLIMEKQIDATLTEWVLPDTYPSGYYWISASNRLKQMGTLVLIQRE